MGSTFPHPPTTSFSINHIIWKPLCTEKTLIINEIAGPNTITDSCVPWAERGRDCDDMRGWYHCMTATNFHQMNCSCVSNFQPFPCDQVRFKDHLCDLRRLNWQMTQSYSPETMYVCARGPNYRPCVTSSCNYLYHFEFIIGGENEGSYLVHHISTAW